MAPFERALVSSYRHSIVTFHLSLRIFSAPAPPFPDPTSSLPKIVIVVLDIGLPAIYNTADTDYWLHYTGQLVAHVDGRWAPCSINQHVDRVTSHSMALSW